MLWNKKIVNEIKRYLTSAIDNDLWDYYPPEECDDINYAGFKILACGLSDGKYTYDYDEHPKKIKVEDKRLKQLIKQYPEYIDLITCSDCCGCGSW